MRQNPKFSTQTFVRASREQQHHHNDCYTENFLRASRDQHPQHNEAYFGFQELLLLLMRRFTFERLNLDD